MEDLFNGFNTDKIFTPTTTDDHGNTIFSTACKFGHKKIVRKTLKWIGTDMNHLNDRQQSGVELAVLGGTRGGPVVAEYLLSKKCEINMFGRNLLHEACLRSYDKVATLVLARGVNPDEVDEKNTTAMHEAVRANSKECVMLLIDAGADKNVQVWWKK